MVQHRPRLLNALGHANGEPSLSLLLLRDFHRLLHFSDDPKLVQLRQRRETVSGLAHRLESLLVSGDAAAASIDPLAEFAALVFCYLCNLSVDYDSVAEAEMALRAAGLDVAMLARRSRRHSREPVGLSQAKNDALEKRLQYDDACKQHREAHAHECSRLLELLTDGSELSRLGNLVLSAPSGRGFSSVIMLTRRSVTACPRWLPSKVLDSALDYMADDRLDLADISESITGALPTVGMSTEPAGAGLETRAQPMEQSETHRIAWEHALSSETRRDTFAFLCMQLHDDSQPSDTVDLLGSAMSLLRMYFSSPPTVYIPGLTTTVDLLLRKSVSVAIAILEKPVWHVALDTLLAFWCEALRPHTFQPTPLGAARTLRDFPQLFAQLFVCAARSRSQATVIWEHLTELLHIALDCSPEVRTAACWLAATVVKMDAELSDSPVFPALAAAPRRALSLVDSPSWGEMLRKAIPVVPASWYMQSAAGSRTGRTGDGLSYNRELQLAHTELEVQAVNERAHRDELARQAEAARWAQAAEGQAQAVEEQAKLWQQWLVVTEQRATEATVFDHAPTQNSVDCESSAHFSVTDSVPAPFNSRDHATAASIAALPAGAAGASDAERPNSVPSVPSGGDSSGDDKEAPSDDDAAGDDRGAQRRLAA